MQQVVNSLAAYAVEEYQLFILNVALLISSVLTVLQEVKTRKYIFLCK